MNREIKFRAWHKGNYSERNREISPPQMLYDLWDGECLLFAHQGQPIELMQYTGLKDRNGVEIYTGDLIKDSDSDFIGEVVWDTDTLCFTTKFQSNELWGFVPRHGKDNHCEVIGNIWENPEVLK